MNDFSPPNFQLQRIVQTGKRQKPQIYCLKQPSKLPQDKRKESDAWKVLLVAASMATLGVISCAPKTRPNIEKLKITAMGDIPKERTLSPKVKAGFEELKAHLKAINSVAFSPDGKILASGGCDNTVKLWELATGKLLYTLEGHSMSIECISFSPNGKYLASGSTDKSIKLWKVAGGKLLHSLEGHSGWLNSVTFSSDSKTLISGSEDRTIRRWDVETGSLLTALTGHSDWLNLFAFSPDIKIFASCHSDNSIKLWDIATGNHLCTLQGHSEWVSSIVFSPDGKTLASGSKDEYIKLWDIATCKLLRTLKGHFNEVDSVAFSPDGKKLASGSKDNNIIVWEVASGKPLLKLNGHSYWVNSVDFSPDGKTLASCSRDKTIKLWDIQDGKDISCLFDPQITLDTQEAIRYEDSNLSGIKIARTLPCGSPIPPGAVCTCNCVPGAYSIASEGIPVQGIFTTGGSTSPADTRRPRGKKKRSRSRFKGGIRDFRSQPCGLPMSVRSL